MGEEPIPDEAVLAALARVLASAELEGSPRLQAFLRHIVEARLAGNERAMRAYAIGVDVFERPADFDPQAESLVRVEAGRLRQKLAAYYAGEGKADPVRITLPKGGYVPRFEAARTGAPAPARTAARAPALTRAKPAPSHRRPYRVAFLTAALIAIAIGIAAHLGLERGSPTAPVEVNGAADLARQTPAIGVLPFEALDDAPGTTTVAGGLTALVTAELTHFRQFFVLARRSALALAEAGGDPIRAAAEAGLDYVVDGTVRRDDEGFVVTASLISTEDAGVLWTRTFTGPHAGNGALALESEIAAAIVTAVAQPWGLVNRQLSRAADQADLPASLASYACILAADHYYATYAPADYTAAKTCLERAVRTEPDYAHAWAYLAYLRLEALRYGYTHDPAGQELAAALEAARKAVELEPENAVAQRSLAAVLFTAGDMDGFRRHADLALELNPNDSDALADLGGKIAYSGDWERGLAMRARAIELNPAHPASYRIPFVIDAYRRGDYAAARGELEQSDLPDFLMTRLLRAAVYGRLGLQRQAAQAVQDLLEVAPDAADRAGEYLGYWQLPPDLVEDLLGGLQSAGLKAA
ncbi:MAG: hypothetical protein R3D25_04235 [Geminicoccaceae bacterium]